MYSLQLYFGIVQHPSQTGLTDRAAACAAAALQQQQQQA